MGLFTNRRELEYRTWDKQKRTTIYRTGELPKEDYNMGFNGPFY